MRTISVNMANERGPLNKSFNCCVAGGRAYETLLAENQRHLGIVAHDCGFRYLRFHRLLHDDMAVYSENQKDNPQYNWQYVDLLFDAMLAMGVKPVCGAVFHAVCIGKRKQHRIFWRGNITMPKPLEK